MSIRNEFEKIDPTEKQKKDIFRRIEESSKVKTDFRHQVIRYTSVAAAAVVVVGTAAVGVHFVTKGNGIDYTVSGSSSGADSAVDASASKVNDNKSDVSDVVSKADENPSHADNSSANGNNTIYPDISTLKAQVRNDKEFWAEIGKQYGPYHYEYSTVRFDFINSFDDFKLCTDEAISNEIIDRVKRQWLFDNIVDFGSGYYAIKGAKDLSTSEDIEKFTRENLINGEYFEADPEFFGFYVSGASYDVYDKVYSQLIYTETFCRNAETIKEQFIRQHLDDNGYPWGKVYKLNLIRENELNFNASLSMNEDHIFVFQYYYLIDTLFIASSCKYHYTVFDNAGRKLSSKSVPFAKIKSTSLIFDKTLESLNEKWAFASADFIKLNQRFVYQKRLQGIAALVKEKNMSSIMDEINYWNSNSYKPQNKKEVLILSILKSHFPLDAVYIMLRLFFKIINSIPRNRKKLIFEDLSRRSNLV